MFRPLRDILLSHLGAGVCYAYLTDVDSIEARFAKESSFGKSCWFVRGWTLQVSTAPLELTFFAASSGVIGSKQTSRT